MYDHVGIYLGNNKVCHIYDYWETKDMKTRIDDTNVFLGKAKDTEGIGNIEVIHPIIPFKHYSQVAQQIAWAEGVEFGKGKYCLANRNCEHFANMLIRGAKHSQQVANDPKKSVTFCFSPKCLMWNGGCKDDRGNHTPEGNDNRGSGTICLRDEISKNSNQLDQLNNWRAKEIKDRIVIDPKEECVIM